MSELNVTSQTKKSGTTCNKKSTRVDLTPLVDLGFLLITFFIFTSALSQPTSMKLILPDDSDIADHNMPTKVSGALTLLPAANNVVYYYEGDPGKAASGFKRSSISKIREVILHKKQSVQEKDLFIIIKPSRLSVYKNVVDILDEMTINSISRFALVDITNAEEKMIDNAEATH